MNGSRRGHGEGSIFKRKDGLWVGVVELGRLDGKRQRRVFYGKTRREVAEALKPALKTHQDGLPLAVDRRTVAEYLNEWLSGTRDSLRARTWLRYEQYVRLHAIPALGRLPLAQLGPQHLRALYADRLAAGASASTVGHLHAVLHKALSQAERDGIMPRNVVGLVTPPRVTRREMRTLSPEQARGLLEVAKGQRLEALYVLALTTGMRQGELLALRWRCVDLDKGVLSVQATLEPTKNGPVFAEPKTAKSRRQVALTTTGVLALRRHRAAQRQERLALGTAWADLDLVFADAVGGALDTKPVTRLLAALLKRASLPAIRFHDLRHTAATLMLGGGVHPKIASEMLGHSTIAITLDLYSHVTPTMQREAAVAIDARLTS